MGLKSKLKSGEEGEALVIKELQKDPKNKYLINNLVLLGKKGMSHQSDHILIRENGIFVIETKNYFGEIYGSEKESTWKKIVRKGSKVETEYFHNPLKQNMSHMKSVKRIIGIDYPVYGFVVFVKNNAAPLDIFSAVNLNEINDRINILTIETNIPENVQKELYTTLLYSEADVNQKAHLDNIKTIKKERHDHQNLLRQAIETRICPKCGTNLNTNKDGLVCPKCKTKFKI